MPHYAVAVGRKPGIYPTWNACKEQVDGFPKARYKKFNTLNEAKEFCEINGKQNLQNLAKSSGNFSSIQSKSNSFALKSLPKNDSSTNTSSFSNKRKFFDDTTVSTLSSLSVSSSRWIHAGSKEDYSNTVIVYTDGACVGNGKKGARAGIGVYWADNHVDNVSEPLSGKQTNNRAEIQAVVTAVRQAKARGHKSVTIRTDSKFLLDSITTWIHKWVKNNWTLSTGAPVKNKEDFKDLLDVMEGIEVQWEKVRAHCGIDGNEKADQFAREGVNKRTRT